MAIFTITTPQNIDLLAGKTGSDTYNINGGVLTIDQDSRVGLNQDVQSTLGAITLSSTLGGNVIIDGRGVWMIPYTSGGGVVPAFNTIITNGTGSGKLIGVHASLTSASVLSGGAMPATGFIRVKQKTGDYVAGALTGITATANNQGRVGWIEIVGTESSTVTVNRLNKFDSLGEWYEVGITSGVSNQTMQIPNNGLLRYVAGVYIEKTLGSNDFEFYPNNGTNTTTGTEEGRGKVVWIDNTGLVRIGNSGVATNGYTPISGLKVVVGNIFFENCTTALRTANVIPNSTIATRYDFTTTGGGVINIDKCNYAWYLSCSQAYSVKVANSSFIDSINLSEIATAMTFTKVGVGNKPTTALLTSALNMSFCFAGGTFTDCVWLRVSQTTTTSHTNSITDCSGFTFVRDKIMAGVIRASSSALSLNALRLKNCTWTNPYIIQGAMGYNTCDRITITDTVFVEAISGNTTTLAGNTWSLITSTNCLISGLTLPIINNQPYTSLLQLTTACDNNRFRNVGTRLSPLNMGTVNSCGLIYTITGACTNTKVQRIYTANTRTGIMTGDNSSKGLIEENVVGDYVDSVDVMAVLNMERKGMGGNGALNAQTSVYGTIWRTNFYTPTAGIISILMNEPTTETANQVSLLNGASYTSTGGLYMPTIGMSATFTLPYYAIGFTGFLNSALNMAGGTFSNYTYFYQLDKNDGAGYSSLSPGLSAGAIGTALSGITGIDASKGIKLKLTITTTATNTTAITSVSIFCTTTLSAQDFQYPLDPVDAIYSFSGLEIGTEVILFDNTNTQIKREVITGTTFQYNYTWTGTDSTGNYALIWKDNKKPVKFENITFGNTSINVPIAQEEDLVYTNTYTDNATIDFVNSLVIMDNLATLYDVQGIYSLRKDTIKLTNNAQYDFAFGIVGGNVISAGKFIPFYTFQDNGWKARPYEGDHTLNVVGGVLVGESGADPFVNTLSPFTVRINYEQPVQAITVSSGGGGGATPADIWNYVTRTLTDKNNFTITASQVSDIKNGLATGLEIDGLETSISTIQTSVNNVQTDINGIETDLSIINEGVKKSSLIIPHTTNL